MGRQDSSEAEIAAALRDVATTSRAPHDVLTLKIDRHGFALRHPAAADRRHALRRVRPAAGGAILHASEHLLCDRGGAAPASRRSGHPRQDLYPLADEQSGWCRSARSRNGQPLRSPRFRSTTKVNSPPSPSKLNLAQGVALGTATGGGPACAMQLLQLPQGLTTTFQGNAQAFQDLLTSVPLLIFAVRHLRLSDPRRALRELRSPAHDPVDASVCVALARWRRSCCLATNYLVALIGTILRSATSRRKES